MNLHGKESWKSYNYETISVTEPFVKCHVWDLFADHLHPATKLHICFQGPFKCPRWSTDLSKKKSCPRTHNFATFSIVLS